MKKTPFVKPISRQFRYLEAGAVVANRTKEVLADRFVVTFIVTWGILIGFTVAFILLRRSGLPSEIPLFYSLPWGEKQLAPRDFIFLPVLGTTLLGIFNLSIGINFYRQEKIITYFLTVTATSLALLSTITTLNIVNLFL